MYIRLRVFHSTALYKEAVRISSDSRATTRLTVGPGLEARSGRDLSLFYYNFLNPQLQLKCGR